MNILHIGKYYPPFHGGMEVYLRDLSEQQAHKHNVTTLVHNHNYHRLTSPTTRQSINGVDVIRQSSFKPILFTPIMMGLNQTIKQLIDKKNVDIIHISWPNPSALLLLFNRKAKALPWVLQWQSDMVTKNSSWLLKCAYQLFKPFEKAILKRVDRIIVSSHQYLKHSNVLPSFVEKCKIIPLGIKDFDPNTNDKTTQWANEQWGSTQYRIYNVGRLTFYKNHQLLIEAASLLPEAQFIITGTGELFKDLSTLIKRKKITNVKLTGALNNEKLNALLASCDAFCLPSNDRAESFGMVLLEALKHGKNIFVSNLPGSGMKWIATQTDLGHTFDCDDAEELVKLTKSLNKNNSATKRMPLPEQLTIKGCALAIDQLYEQMYHQK